MGQFPTHKHLASRGLKDVCPGNEESAGKRRSGKTRPKGSKWLRSALTTESARAAAARSPRGAILQRSTLASEAFHGSKKKAGRWQ